jgi:flavodoxin I
VVIRTAAPHHAPSAGKKKRYYHIKILPSQSINNTTTIMYFSALVATSLLISCQGFSAISSKPVSRANTALNSVGLFYATSTGNTETVAEYIAKAAGGIKMDDIGGAKDSDVLGHDSIIVGAPTWITGADDRRSGTSFDAWLYDTLPNLDIADKKIAIFGVGDQESYSDNYCDAAGELYDLFTAKGCKVYGLTSQDGYGHQESKAVKDGKFCG